MRTHNSGRRCGGFGGGAAVQPARCPGPRTAECPRRRAARNETETGVRRETAASDRGRPASNVRSNSAATSERHRAVWRASASGRPRSASRPRDTDLRGKPRVHSTGICGLCGACRPVWGARGGRTSCGVSGRACGSVSVRKGPRGTGGNSENALLLRPSQISPQNRRGSRLPRRLVGPRSRTLRAGSSDRPHGKPRAEAPAVAALAFERAARAPRASKSETRRVASSCALLLPLASPLREFTTNRAGSFRGSCEGQGYASNSQNA